MEASPIIKKEVIIEADGLIKVKENAEIKGETIQSDEIGADHILVKRESVSMKKILKCDECEKVFLKAWALMSHKRTHSGEKLRMVETIMPIIKQEVIIEADGSINVEENPENKAETIESDDIETDNLSVEHEHFTLKKKFKCDECEKVFPIASLLAYHKRVHSGEKPYQCSECDYASSRSGPLRLHKRVHSGEKPHTCNECNFVCSGSGNLKRHKLIHTGEKPYSCDICDYSTTQSGELKLHKMVHTGERPHKCDLCDKKFQRKHHLVVHRRTHTGIAPSSQPVFACLKCGFTTNSQWNLKSHNVSHSEDKPFACEQCNFKCKHSATLKKHERTHSGERPYTCEECGKKFAQSGALNTHKKRIHLKNKK